MTYIQYYDISIQLLYNGVFTSCEQRAAYIYVINYIYYNIHSLRFKREKKKQGIIRLDRVKTFMEIGKKSSEL